LLSTITGCPSLGCNFSAMIRAMISGPVPGENGTTMVTGRRDSCASPCTLPSTLNSAARRPAMLQRSGVHHDELDPGRARPAGRDSNRSGVAIRFLPTHICPSSGHYVQFYHGEGAGQVARHFEENTCDSRGWFASMSGSWTSVSWQHKVLDACLAGRTEKIA
jgi:hypothetical protein